MNGANGHNGNGESNGNGNSFMMAEKARLEKLLAHEEIRILISAIGASFGEDFDLAKLRYSKIIIMTDADVDGSHIRTLLLNFFFHNMQPLIDEGHLYIAQPPLYRVQQGRQVTFQYTEAQQHAAMKKMEGKRGVSIQRYKGLGEMNPDLLWETTLDPQTRTLLQVTMEDAQLASDDFDHLMGANVEPRKKFIFEYAKTVQNLDV